MMPSLRVETLADLYRQWNTPEYGVTLCRSDNGELALDVIEKASGRFRRMLIPGLKEMTPQEAALLIQDIAPSVIATGIAWHQTVTL